MTSHHHLESMLSMNAKFFIFLAIPRFYSSALKATHDDFRDQLSTLCQIVENYQEKNNHEHAKTLIEMAFKMKASQFEKKSLTSQKLAKFYKLFRRLSDGKNYEMIDIDSYEVGYVMRQEKKTFLTFDVFRGKHARSKFWKNWAKEGSSFTSTPYF